MLTSFQRKKLAHFFNILDFNRTGSLEIEDFAELCENIRTTFGFEEGGAEHQRVVNRTTRFFHHLLSQVHHNQKMSLELNDWLEFAESHFGEEIDEDLLDEYVEEFIGFFFDLFDSNHDGFISLDEYHQLFSIYGIDSDYARSSFEKIDRNQDIRLSRYELLYAGKVFFTSDDKTLKGNWIFGKLKEIG